LLFLVNGNGFAKQTLKVAKDIKAKVNYFLYTELVFCNKDLAIKNNLNVFSNKKNIEAKLKQLLS
jgi:hypothetical protein